MTHAGLTNGLSSLAPLVARQTAPVKVPRPTTVIVEVPLLSDSRNTKLGVAETLKPCSALATLTETVVVLDNVLGLVPVEPVIVKVKLGGVGTVAQLTVNVVPETPALQPNGAALVENARAPANPLIAVNDKVEVLGAPTTMLSEDGLAETEKSTTWNVTEFDTMPSGEPVTVAV